MHQAVLGALHLINHWKLDSIIDSMDMSFSKLQKIVKDREAWSVAAHGATQSWTQLSNWTATNEGDTVASVIRTVGQSVGAAGIG